MRKDTANITSGVLPEHQDTISKLSSFHQINAQMNKVEEETGVLKTMTRKVIDTSDEEFDLMVEKIRAYTSVEEIHALTEEQVDEVFTNAAGELIKFYGNKETTEEEIKEIRRDYIEFVFNTETEMERLTQAQEELATMFKESDQEIRELYESIGGDITAYITELMEQEHARISAIENPTDEEKSKLARINAVNKSLSEAITLDPIIEYVTKYDARNIIDDYKRNSENIGAAYARKSKDIKLTANLTTFRNVEKLFIKDTALHVHDDLFTFIVMRYLARKKDANVLDGVFISQLSYELRCLYTINPETATESQKLRRENLIANISTVLGIVYTKLGLL